MRCCDLIDIKKGATAVIGGGGKTTMLYVLGRELAELSSVIIMTTTRIKSPAHMPVILNPEESEITAALLKSRLICVGSPKEENKLGAPTLPVSKLCCLAEYVIIEADGSRGLPFKAHAKHEPVIPEECGQTVLIAGASGFGKPVKRAAHRPEQYARLAACGFEDEITPEIAARVIKTEGLHNSVFINQTESGKDRENALLLARLLDCPAYAGALQKGVWDCLY